MQKNFQRLKEIQECHFGEYEVFYYTGEKIDSITFEIKRNEKIFKNQCHENESRGPDNDPACSKNGFQCIDSNGIREVTRCLCDPGFGGEICNRHQDTPHRSLKMSDEDRCLNFGENCHLVRKGRKQFETSGDYLDPDRNG